MPESRSAPQAPATRRWVGHLRPGARGHEVVAASYPWPWPGAPRASRLSDAAMTALFCRSRPGLCCAPAIPTWGACMKTSLPIATLLLILALLVAPLAAQAQPAGKVYRIGWLANDV